MKVLLVHGMGRTPVSMLQLARGLRAAGTEVELFGYVSTVESLERIVNRLAARLEHIAHQPYVVVGHSLGGLLLRMAIARLGANVRRPERLVLLGTPVHAPRLARRLHRWLPYRLLHGESGQLLGDPERMEAIPQPTVPCTVVVGTRGPRWHWLFGGEPNDGLVSVEEAMLGCGEDVITLRRSHTWLMNAREVRAIVLDAQPAAG